MSRKKHRLGGFTGSTANRDCLDLWIINSWIVISCKPYTHRTRNCHDILRPEISFIINFSKILEAFFQLEYLELLETQIPMKTHCMKRHAGHSKTRRRTLVSSSYPPGWISYGMAHVTSIIPSGISNGLMPRVELGTLTTKPQVRFYSHMQKAIGIPGGVIES